MSRWLRPLVLLVPALLARADDRSIERFRYECASPHGRRDVTLFANGTVRLRQGPAEAAQMYLAELGPEELAAELARLAHDDATDGVAEHGWAHAAQGPWVEQCSIVLTLEDRPEERYELSALDVPPLRVARFVRIAEELAARARPAERARRLPDDYRPEPGHLLQNAEGQRFLVKGFTSDLQGIELEGVDQPVTVFVSREHLTSYFFPVMEPEPR